MRWLVLAALLAAGCSQKPDPVRTEFPQFRGHFEKGSPCYVEVAYEARPYTEELWVRVNALEGDRIKGVVETEPVQVKIVKKGDAVQTSLAEITDWYVTDAAGKKVAGGYTLAE